MSKRRQREYGSPPEMGGDSSKRVRFDSDEDPVDGGEFDFPNSKPRRGAVKDTDGYHSDSSDEGESIHSKPKPSNADDEDDMFGASTAGGAGLTKGMPDLDAKDNDTRVKDTGLQLKGDASKGGKEYLELGDIEGQEFTSEAYSTANQERRKKEQNKEKVHDEEIDYVEGEEHANDDDAIVPKQRKSATDMGFAMSKFNMQEEMQEGRFSADGTYTANDKDPDAVHDNWLAALTAKDLQSAAAAKERQDALLANRAADLAKNTTTRVACLKMMLEGNGGLVKEGESVQSALARLGKARKVEVEEEKERLKLERRKNKGAKPKKDFDAPDEEPQRPSTTNDEERRKVETQDMDLDPLAPPAPSASSIKGKEKAHDGPTSATKQAIDTLTTLASTLLGTYGETNIYEETHEGIIRQLIAEAEVPRNWKPANESPDAMASINKVDKDEQYIKPKKSLINRPVISRPKA